MDVRLYDASSIRAWIAQADRNARAEAGEGERRAYYEMLDELHGLLYELEVIQKGDRGSDRLTGGEGSDTIVGRDGNDTIDLRDATGSTAGSEEVAFGLAGNDTIYAADGNADTIYCGAGKRDSVTYDQFDTVNDETLHTADCEKITLVVVSTP